METNGGNSPRGDLKVETRSARETEMPAGQGCAHAPSRPPPGSGPSAGRRRREVTPAAVARVVTHFRPVAGSARSLMAAFSGGAARLRPYGRPLGLAGTRVGSAAPASDSEGFSEKNVPRHGDPSQGCLADGDRCGAPERCGSRRGACTKQREQQRENSKSPHTPPKSHQNPQHKTRTLKMQ